MEVYFLLSSMDRKSALLFGAGGGGIEEDCVWRRTELGTKETCVLLVRVPPPNDDSSLSVFLPSRRGGGLLNATVRVLSSKVVPSVLLIAIDAETSSSNSTYARPIQNVTR